MGAWTHPVKAKLALGIRNNIGAIFQIDAHAGHAHFVIVLNSIFITVRKHLANDVSAIGKHTTHHIHLCGGDVGFTKKINVSACAISSYNSINAITLQCARTNPYSISELDLLRNSHMTDVKYQTRPTTPKRIGHGLAINPGRTRYIRKARWQCVSGQYISAIQRNACIVANRHTVIGEFTNLCKRTQGSFLNKQATDRARINRDINNHWPGVRADAERTAIRPARNGIRSGCKNSAARRQLIGRHD